MTKSEVSIPQATAETDATNVIAQAKARAEAMTIEASARATATRLQAEAEAASTRIKAEADAAIRDEYAQGIAQRRIEVERTKAFGDKTVFAPIEALNNGGIGGFTYMQGSSGRK